MSQIRLTIFVILFTCQLPLLAQGGYNEEQDKVAMNVQNLIEQARLESDRGDYFPAKDHLEKALQLAQSIDDRKTQGVIYTKLAKIEFLVEEPKQAIFSLQKAQEIQRELSLIHI